MKKTIINILTIAAVLACGARASAAGFDLDGIKAGNVPVTSDKKAPVALAQDPDELIGIDLTVRIPFKLMQSELVKMTATDKRLTILDQSAPVISKAGEFMKVGNISLNVNGFIVNPTITLKPSLEGKDKLAIKIQKIAVHASMTPDDARNDNFQPVKPPVAGAPAVGDNGLPTNITQEEIMTQGMDIMIKTIYSSLNDKLKAKHLAMKAEDILSLKYDKETWTLHAKFSAKVLRTMLPDGLVGVPHLTGFALTNAGLTLKVQTAE